MSTSKNKYEKIIKQLQETEPVLQDKEELTAKIISKIEQEKFQSLNKVNAFTLVIRPAMTAAAFFLVGLFLFQQVDYTPEFSEPKIPKTIDQNAINDFRQIIENRDELSEELRACIDETKSESKKMDRECVMKLISLYKKMERQKPKSYKQWIKNRFNY